MQLRAGPGWLEDLIEQALRTTACTRWNCTTCGSAPFREALRSGATINGGTSRNALLDELSMVSARAELELPVRFIIMLLYASPCGSASVQELEEVLVGSFAGAVLERMKAHHENVRGLDPTPRTSRRAQPS